MNCINFCKKFCSVKLLALTAAVLTIMLLAANSASAQTMTIDLGEDAGSTTARMIQLFLITTVLSIAPSILVMTTSFTRIVIVFGILRKAMATQTAPPNTVIVGLALFMTAFIMQPTFEKSWNEGLKPMINEEIDEKEAIERTIKPFHTFMIKNVREKDLELFLGLAKIKDVKKKEDIPLTVLIPAFMISECRRAFEMGFLIYLPFVIIDMVIASVLMSMGMMMLPPVMLAMPFKLIFFVLIDGWYMLCGSLVQSFNP